MKLNTENLLDRILVARQGATPDDVRRLGPTLAHLPSAELKARIGKARGRRERSQEEAMGNDLKVEDDMDLNELLSRHQRSLLIAAGDVSTVTRCTASQQADEYAKAINRGRFERARHPMVLSATTLLTLLDGQRGFRE